MSPQMHCFRGTQVLHHIFRNLDKPQVPSSNPEGRSDGIHYAAETGRVHGDISKQLGKLKASTNLVPAMGEMEPEPQDNKIQNLERTTDLQKNMVSLLSAMGVLETAALDPEGGKKWEKNNDYVYVKFAFEGKVYRMMLDNDTTGWDIEITDANGKKVYDTTDGGSMDIATDATDIREVLAGGDVSLLKPTTELHKGALALVKGLGGEKITLAEGSTWNGNNDYLTLEFVLGEKKYTLMLDNDNASWDIELTEGKGNVVYSATDWGSLNVKSDVEAIREAMKGKPAEEKESGTKGTEEKNEVSAAYRLGSITHGSTLTGMDFKPEKDYGMGIHRYLGRDDGGLDYALVYMPSQRTNGILRFRASPIVEKKKYYGMATETNDVTVAFLAIKASDWGTVKEGDTKAVRDFIQARNGSFWEIHTYTTSKFTSKEFQNTKPYKEALTPLMNEAKNQ